MKALVPQRQQVLQQEEQKQINNERLRQQFAAKANEVGQWIEVQLDSVAAICVQTKTSLEDQLIKLQQYDKAVAAYRPNMDDLEKYHQVRTTFSFTCLLTLFTTTTIIIIPGLDILSLFTYIIFLYIILKL